MVSKAQVMALASGDAWLAKGANILLFGPPGGGKSHLSAALGLALVENHRAAVEQRQADIVIAAKSVIPWQPVDNDRWLVLQKRQRLAQHHLIG